MIWPFTQIELPKEEPAWRVGPAPASAQRCPVCDGRGRDREIKLRNFRSARFTLTEELIVLLEERDGQYVASSFDTGQYGHGYSPEDAIAHLCSVVEEYFDLLCEDEGRLSEQRQAHLRYLRSILREI